MKILVCIKQVPSTNKVEIDPESGVLKRDGAVAKINPYDLFALELAFRLRGEHGGRVAALTMGPPQAESSLLEAIHMGADGGILLTDRRFAGADVLATSRALAAGIRKTGSYDLIICGKQTTDGDTGQIGPELAEMLGLAQASYVQAFRIERGAAIAEVNFGEWILEQRMPLPCLITVEKDIHTPRLPSYRRSLAARTNEILRLSLDDMDCRDEALYGLAGSPTRVERIFAPDKNEGRVLHEGTAEELAELAFEALSSGNYLADRRRGG